MKKRVLVLIALTAVLLLVAVPVAALPDGPTSMNARFVKWQEKPQVIHIMVFDDDGRPTRPPAVVDAGQPVLFGFEWGCGTLTVEECQEDVDATTIRVWVDGDPPMNVSDLQQPAFSAATQSGAAWSWDHDGDGPGDGDGDGIGDWNATVSFFRYQHPGMASGTHTFYFLITNPDGTTVDDTITVVVP